MDYYNYPVVCAGVLVYPGDLIIANMDGVLVVPRKKALAIGKAAKSIMKDDQAKRKELLDKIRNEEEQTKK